MHLSEHLMNHKGTKISSWWSYVLLNFVGKYFFVLPVVNSHQRLGEVWSERCYDCI